MTNPPEKRPWPSCGDTKRTEQPQAEPGQCAPGRHSIISEPPWRASSSEKQVRAGRLDFGAERMAHVNRQSVCSVEPALWADSWQRVSAGVVRRAACRSEIPSMFAVRMRVSRSRRSVSSHRLVSNLRTSAWAQSPGAPHAPYAHRVPQSESQIVSLAAGATRPVSGA